MNDLIEITCTVVIKIVVSSLNLRNDIHDYIYIKPLNWVFYLLIINCVRTLHVLYDVD